MRLHRHQREPWGNRSFQNPDQCHPIPSRHLPSGNAGSGHGVCPPISLLLHRGRALSPSMTILETAVSPFALARLGVGIAVVPICACRAGIRGVRVHPISDKEARWTVGAAWGKGEKGVLVKSFRDLGADEVINYQTEMYLSALDKSLVRGFSMRSLIPSARGTASIIYGYWRQREESLLSLAYRT
jgi:DNA-binding transcriptional LysR family regulator